jgi:hypothetical protein
MYTLLQNKHQLCIRRDDFFHSWDYLKFKVLVGVLGTIKSGNVVTFLSNLASNSVTLS